jgi:hypothetical protein
MSDTSGRLLQKELEMSVFSGSTKKFGKKATVTEICVMLMTLPVE